jgi:SAM-dependent methyltransferase
MRKEKKYLEIKSHYEDCLDKYGDSHKGVDWPNETDATTRYKVMLEVIRDSTKEVSILDLGCGAGHLFDFIQETGIPNLNYSGLDISEKYIKLCKDKFPQVQFIAADILEDSDYLPFSDYVIMNGVFTEKRKLSHGEMFNFLKKMLITVFPKVGIGLAFNVMSKIVDWEREDLFHLSFDAIGEFLTKELSRNFIIRNDYGLYEYTVYLYK